MILLDESNIDGFPDPLFSSSDTPLALSYSLGPQRIISAYRKGIFPWMKQDFPPALWCWFSPNPRMVLYPDQLNVSRSLEKAIQGNYFVIKVDQDFQATMQACANSKRPGQESTWIEREMIEDYCKLHQLGIAHSIEAFIDNQRVGGLYGLAMGKIFFGESMFYKEAEASKLCLAYLVKLSLKFGIDLIDCQAHTPHLEKMGAIEIPRIEFIQKLEKLVEPSKSVIPWEELKEVS